MDSANDDLERILLSKQGGIHAPSTNDHFNHSNGNSNGPRDSYSNNNSTSSDSASTSMSMSANGYSSLAFTSSSASTNGSNSAYASSLAPSTGTTLPSVALTSTNRFNKTLLTKLKGPRSVAQTARAEEEARARAIAASENWRATVSHSENVRREFFKGGNGMGRVLRVSLQSFLVFFFRFGFDLALVLTLLSFPPFSLSLIALLSNSHCLLLNRCAFRAFSFLSSQGLKESADECDLGTQYHLSRYSYLFESTLVNDGMIVSPVSMEDGEFPSLAFSSSDIASQLIIRDC